MHDGHPSESGLLRRLVASTKQSHLPFPATAAGYMPRHSAFKKQFSFTTQFLLSQGIRPSSLTPASAICQRLFVLGGPQVLCVLSRTPERRRAFTTVSLVISAEQQPCLGRQHCIETEIQVGCATHRTTIRAVGASSWSPLLNGGLSSSRFQTSQRSDSLSYPISCRSMFIWRSIVSIVNDCPVH
jgi:hypothetical protein